ncbi:MAG TPA: hypothetical protein V6D00_01455 [Pantanalinema sp.]
MQASVQLVGRAGAFLKNQATDGFPDALDLQFGLMGHAILVGSVFQVALATMALHAALPDDAEAQAIVARETDAILALGSPDGWRYFNLCPEIPPDADVLAQVVTLLHRVGRRDRLESLDGPLALLEQNRLQAGRFRTWLCSSLDEAGAADALWGAGTDPVHPEVVGNLLGALLLIDPGRYAHDARMGADWLARQDSGGLYPSYWYYGLGYGTYQAIRMFDLLLKQAPEQFGPAPAEAMRRARDAMLRAQLPSGGWAATQGPTGLAVVGGQYRPEREAGALETAFTVLALRRLEPDPGISAALESAEGFLSRCQQEDGGFAAEPFYFTLGPRPLASRCLTTAAVLLALTD